MADVVNRSGEKHPMRSRLVVIAYWAVTVVVALETLVGGFADLVNGRALLLAGPPVADVVTHLGYPIDLLYILGFWKLLGGIVLLLPGWPRLKEWAYAGIFFELSGAAASWLAYAHDVRGAVAPMVLAFLVLVSRALLPTSQSSRDQLHSMDGSAPVLKRQA